MTNRITLEKLYAAAPTLSLYDDPPDGDPPATPPAKPTGLGFNSDDPNAPVVTDPDARFDQEAVNKIVQDRLAKDRKKHEEKHKGLEKSYKDLLASKALTEEERERIQGQYDDLQKQNRTKEEQAKHEKRQLQDKYENELQEFKEAAVKWETQHKEYMIRTALTDAAVTHDAFLPAQIYDIVRKWTKLVDATDESGKPTGQLIPVVDLPDVDADTGKPIITQRTPSEAVERLKEKLQPNLFKSNIVSGVGGNSSTGDVIPGADGRIDQKDLTTDQWMKMYKEDPTKLGLRPRRR